MKEEIGMDYWFPFHNEPNSDIYKAYREKWVSALNEYFEEQIKIDSKINTKLCLEKMQKCIQEEHSMYDSITVSCRGFSGELKMLVKTAAGSGYNMSIRDTENPVTNPVTHVLEDVKPNEIKLVSGMVMMGG